MKIEEKKPEKKKSAKPIDKETLRMLCESVYSDIKINTDRRDNNTIVSLIIDYSNLAGISPRQCDIVDVMLPIKNKLRKKKCIPGDENAKDSYDISSVQSMVSKSLKALLFRKKILQIPDKRYVMYSFEHWRAEIGEKILKEIKFKNYNPIVIDNSMVILAIEENLPRAKELFSEYIGEELGFGSLIQGEFLILFVQSIMCRDYSGISDNERLKETIEQDEQRDKEIKEKTCNMIVGLLNEAKNRNIKK